MAVCKSQMTQDDRADRVSANMYRTQARAKQTNGDAMNPESNEGGDERCNRGEKGVQMQMQEIYNSCDHEVLVHRTQGQTLLAREKVVGSGFPLLLTSLGRGI